MHNIEVYFPNQNYWKKRSNSMNFLENCIFLVHLIGICVIFYDEVI